MEDTPMEGGSYTLILRNREDTVITVGALGEIRFDNGIYLYNGSAQGSGGFKRISRHRAVCNGENTVRHWHIDYLLGASTVQFHGAVTASGDQECRISEELPYPAVPGFGASDCSCDAHLLRIVDGRDAAVDLVEHTVADLYREMAGEVTVHRSADIP